MNKNMKRAFTITELVIVIAVVAILAAVLIPTFSNLIEKANVSNDTVLVRNLNEALIIAETTEGKPATMHDALTAVAEQGYTVEKLTPRSTGDILWEQTSNRFALVKDNEIVFGDDSTKAEIGYTYWKITSDLEEVSTGEYSYYLADEVDESVLTEALAVSTGLDVGNNSNIAINYANNEASATAQNVIFRTNGGSLAVNGSKDTVSHYGTANVVEIKAVAGNSYHEYGTILGNISLEQGRVVLENKSEVSSVVVTATSLTNIAIEDKSGNNTTVAATNDTVAGQLATSDKISGTTNVQETVVDETQMSLFAGGIGTEASPYLIDNEIQLLSVSDDSIEGEKHFALTKSIVLCSTLRLENENSLFLNLNGCTITLSYKDGDAGLFDLYGKAELSLSGNGKIDFDDAYLSDESNSIGYIFRLDNQSVLNIYDGYYYGGLTIVQGGGSSVCKIYGGTFEALVNWGGSYWLLNLVDKTEAQIIVSGGVFYNYNPADSHTESPVANFVAPNYESVKVFEQNNIVHYQVVPKE